MRLKVLAVTWCSDSRQAKEFSAGHRTGSDWVAPEVCPDDHAAMERLKFATRVVPTVVFRDGSTL